MVALIAMPASAPSPTIARASRRRSISRWKPTRFKSSAEASGASVLPAAMKAAPSGEGPIGRFTANAAKAIGEVAHRTLEDGLTQQKADDHKAGDVCLEVPNLNQVHRHRGDVENRVRDLGKKRDDEKPQYGRSADEGRQLRRQGLEHR